MTDRTVSSAQVELRMGQQVRIIPIGGCMADVRRYDRVIRGRVEQLPDPFDPSRAVCIRDMATGAPYWYPADPQFWVSRHGIAEYHI